MEQHSTENTCIYRTIHASKIVVLEFDRPDSRVNIFDSKTFEELNQHLDWIDSQAGIKGLILTSRKKGNFMAGADIHTLANANNKELSAFIKKGQDTFQRIATLSILTLSAIHGACLGGGFEMVLACDFRIATSDKTTRIGLPETQLGILPAWGGSMRLPRRIGVIKALKMILSGKAFSPKKLLKMGAIDALVPKEYLLPISLQYIENKKPVYKKHCIINSKLARYFFRKKIKKQLTQKTRGHYPALLKALETVLKTPSLSVKNALSLEHDAAMELAQNTVTGNLLHLFFLRENAKKKRYLDSEELGEKKFPLHSTAVIGAGVMGAGIAHWLSSRQLPVLLQEINPKQLANGMRSIAQLYKSGLHRRVLTSHEAQRRIDCLYPNTTPIPLQNIDLVIEAAVENLEIKKNIFRDLEKRTRPDTILATNTSALPISKLAETLEYPQRVIGLHFFNPVHRMLLVEIIVPPKTSPEVVQRTLDFVRKIKKLPVIVKDSPGFLVNRILMPYLMEAVCLFNEGAEIEKIDAAMLEFGMPMGPLRLLDEVGIDVSLHVAQTLSEAFEERFILPDLFQKMLDEKYLGRKSGKGFYLHNKHKKEITHTQLSTLREMSKERFFAEDQLQERMTLLMINEAARCLEEEVVTSAEEIDFAMVMGTGFAPFRGGVLRYADTLGVAKILERLLYYYEQHRPHFEPSSYIQNLAQNNKTFYQ